MVMTGYRLLMICGVLNDMCCKGVSNKIET